MLTKVCSDCDGSGRDYWNKYGGNDPDIIDRGPCKNDNCEDGEVSLRCDGWKCRAPAGRIVDGAPLCDACATEAEQDLLEEEEFREARLREMTT